jgi:hypothetical protein
MRYEPLPCGGKGQVLKLKDALVRDKANMIAGVYFLIDRDFDDLQGVEPHERLFMTDRYSVENYLVSRKVIESLLTNEFHCHGRPKLRAIIGKRFDDLYEDFLRITMEINFHIFVHRICNKDLQSATIPKKIGQLAKVTSDTVASPEIKPEMLLPLPESVAHEHLLSLRKDFESLDGSARYRGKFALLFLKRWLDQLMAEYASENGGVFAELERTAGVREREFVLSNFASISVLPNGLDAFVEGIQPPLAA